MRVSIRFLRRRLAHGPSPRHEIVEATERRLTVQPGDLCGLLSEGSGEAG